MPKFILHQSAKFSTRQYFRLYGMVNYLSQLDILLIALYETILENNIGGWAKLIPTEAISILSTEIM